MAIGISSGAWRSMCRPSTTLVETICSVGNQRSSLLYASIVALSMCLNVSDATAQEATAQGKIDLTVKIEDIQEIRGTMLFAVYNNSEAFLDEDLAFQLDAVPVEDRQLSWTTSLPTGTYAIAVFHDVNDNGTLDTKIFGLPTEPYGFSNNAKGRFGPPNFSSASMELSESTNISISVK